MTMRKLGEMAIKIPREPDDRTETRAIGGTVTMVLAMSMASQAAVPSEADWRWLDQFREAA